jgi:hypothetical protein
MRAGNQSEGEDEYLLATGREETSYPISIASSAQLQRVRPVGPACSCDHSCKPIQDQSSCTYLSRFLHPLTCVCIHMSVT